VVVDVARIILSNNPDVDATLSAGDGNGGNVVFFCEIFQ